MDCLYSFHNAGADRIPCLGPWLKIQTLDCVALKIVKLASLILTVPANLLGKAYTFCATITTPTAPLPHPSLIIVSGNSPTIVSDQWGEIIIQQNGQKESFKDAIIDSHSTAKEWNWKDTSMSHNPGVGMQQVNFHLFSSGQEIPHTVILSTGRGHGGDNDNSGPGILQMQSGIKNYLEKKGVSTVIIDKTAKAIGAYNRCVQENAHLPRHRQPRIVAFIHTTC